MTSFELEKRQTTKELAILIGAIVASVAFVMELTLLPLILGAIQQDFGLSLNELSWVFNSYALAIAVAVLTGGLIGDMVNKHLLFAIGVLLFAIGSVLSAMSGDLPGLIASRTVQGFGGGLFSPLIPILLTQSGSKRSGKILMIWGGVAGVAATSLPIFGNLILTGLGWRAIFYIFAGVSIIALALVALGNARSKLSARRGMPNLQTLKSLQNIQSILIYIFLTYGCFTFFLFYSPIQLQTNGSSTQVISFFLVCVWASFSTLSFALKDRIDGPGLQRCLLIAPILLALAFGIGLIPSVGFVAQVVSAVLAGAGLACCNSPSTHLLLRLSPPDLRVFASSLDIIFARCGGVMTVALFSDIVPNQALFAVLLLCALAYLCSQTFMGLERKNS